MNASTKDQPTPDGVQAGQAPEGAQPAGGEYAVPGSRPAQPAATVERPTARGAATGRSEWYRPRPRTGPIVWGALVLSFCAYVAVHTAGGAIDATGWIIATVIGLGVLLLAVGGAVLIRNGRSSRGARNGYDADGPER